MDVLDRVEKKEIRNLLGKGWLTHDGMWFYHTCREFGIESANALNKAAIKSLAPIEVERMKRTLGISGERFDTFDELMDFMLAALELTLPDSIFNNFHLSSPARDIIHWRWENGQCFAYKGMQQAGLIDRYDCGVIYRVKCWFEALGVAYSMQPALEECRMHKEGVCKGEFRILSLR